MAEFDIRERPAPALVFAFREGAAVAPAYSPPDPEPDPVAPTITRQPAITNGSEVGDTVTLDLGAATGSPTPFLTWDVRLGGASVKSQAVLVSPGVYSLALSAAGALSLTASWTNAAATIQATPAALTVTEPENPPVPVAPTITRQPAITPAGAGIGDSVTVDFGAASGTPAPVATWDLTLGGVSIKDRLDVGANTMELAVAGTYRLTASWANSAGNVTATAAELVVAAPPAAINYDTALAYLDAATPYAGTPTAVTGISMRGTGAYALAATGTGNAIQRTADGFVFADGVYLQTGVMSGQPNGDGLFAVVDFTLASYGSNIGQILEGAGGHVKVRNNAGTLQVVGQDDTAVTINMGSVVYGQRMILAGMIDDIADVVAGITAAGADVSAAHTGMTDPALTRVITGRYLNGTLHRMAIFARPEGGAWPVTMREVFADFQRGV